MLINFKNLEAKINDLNKWLQEPANKYSSDYKLKEANRNYYVNKLIEMENEGLKTIKI